MAGPMPFCAVVSVCFSMWGIYLEEVGMMWCGHFPPVEILLGILGQDLHFVWCGTGDGAVSTSAGLGDTCKSMLITWICDLGSIINIAVMNSACCCLTEVSWPQNFEPSVGEVPITAGIAWRAPQEAGSDCLFMLLFLLATDRAWLSSILNQFRTGACSWLEQSCS